MVEGNREANRSRTKNKPRPGEKTEGTRTGKIMTVDRLLQLPNRFFEPDGARGLCRTRQPFVYAMPTLQARPQTGDGALGKRKTESRFSTTFEEQLDRELSIRAEERSRERARIPRDLHNTLFQGFYDASMLLHKVVEAMPVRSLEGYSLGNALRVIRRVLKEGRSVLRDLRAPEFAPSSIEQEICGFLKKFSSGVVRCEVNVTGGRKKLKPAFQEQISSIAREALLNALLHSEATCIEAEIEYFPRRLRVIVRDNGRGIDTKKARTQGDPHRGLLGMRDRAESLGARLAIWSRPNAGTEVEISLAGQAFAGACASDV
jgi:signal transduction histidine kinase